MKGLAWKRTQDKRQRRARRRRARLRRRIEALEAAVRWI